jgi:HAD superfamily hydrolase (TIGR01549 family)
MKQIRTVIFDFDGTLANTQEAIRSAFIETLKDIQAPLPIGPFLDQISCQTLEGMFHQVGVVDEELTNYAVSEYQSRYRSVGPQLATLFAGVSETLNTLNEFNFSLAIGTNEVRDNLDTLLPALRIRQYFPVTVCEDEVAYPKPYPEMAYKIMDEVGSAPSETLIVGDSTLDIETGKATGCHTIGVTYGTHTENQLRRCSPDWIIHSPTELLKVLGLSPFPEDIWLQQQVSECK